MEMSKISANAGATVASMARCLQNAGVGVGASTGSGDVVGETETILGPRIDISTHHNGVTGRACSSTQNVGRHFDDEVYHHSHHPSLEVNQSLSSSNHLNDIGETRQGNNNDEEINCSVSVTVQSSTALRTNCQQPSCGNKNTSSMGNEMYPMDESNLNGSNGSSFLPTMNNISKMNVNDNLNALCGLLSASVPTMSVNGHTEESNDETDFDGIDLGNDDDNDSCVPLGEILEKLQAEEAVANEIYTRGTPNEEYSSTIGPTSSTTTMVNNGNSACSIMGKFSLETNSLISNSHKQDHDDDSSNLIRLHAVNETFHDGDSPTISATVNVATLDLSDPESIHQHLSQLNDTVLRVSAEPFMIRSPSPFLLSNAVTTSTTSETLFESSTSCSSSNHDLAPLTPLDNNTSSTSLMSDSPSSCPAISPSKNVYKDNSCNPLETNSLSFQDSSVSTSQPITTFEPINVEVKLETKHSSNLDDMYEDNSTLIPSTTSQIKCLRQSTSTVVGNLVSSLMSPSSQQSPGGSTSSTSTCSSNQIPPPPSPFLTPTTTIALPTSPVPVSISLPSSPCPIGSTNLNHCSLNTVSSLPPASPIPPPSPSTHTMTPNTTPTNSPMLSRRSSSSGTKTGSSGSQAACAVCFKTFSNASALAKHRLTHSEERRYHCTICSKAFKRQDHLNGHLLTHRSTKPFACQVEGCGKSYCDARSLRRHRENHHNNKNKKDDQQEGSNNKNNLMATSNSNSQPKLSTPNSIPNSAILTINTDKPNITNISSSITNNNNTPEHLITTCKSVLGGDTKVKFSSKGLTAQQLQIIQKIFKETKADVTNNSASGSVQSKHDTTSSTYTPMQLGEPPTSVSLVAAKALAAVQSPPKGPVGNVANSPNVLQRQKSLDRISSSTSSPSSGNGAVCGKPVECGICSRKFKNVPALNGHMRLHGGYYKKDEHGKRITGMSDHQRRNKGSSSHSIAAKCGANKIDRSSAAGIMSSKRKLSTPAQQSKTVLTTATSNINSITTSSGLSVFPTVGATNGEGNQDNYLNPNQGLTGSSLSISPLNSTLSSGGLLMHQRNSISNTICSTTSSILKANSFEPPMKKPALSDLSLGGILRHPSSQPPSPSLAFCSLPPPDTNRLLANLELKAAQQQQLLTISNPPHPLTSSYNTNYSSDTEVVGAIARNTSLISGSPPNPSQNILKAMEFCKSTLLDGNNKSLQITPTLLTTITAANNTLSISEMPLQSSRLQISPVALTSNVCSRSITHPCGIQLGNNSVSLPTMPLPVSSVENSQSSSIRLPANIASMMASSSLSLPKIITSKLNILNGEKQSTKENLNHGTFIPPNQACSSRLRQSSMISSIKPNGIVSQTTHNIFSPTENMVYSKAELETLDTTSSLANAPCNSHDPTFGTHFVRDLHANTTPKTCNMLKVDHLTDKTPKIGAQHQADIPSLIKTEIIDELTDITSSNDNVRMKMMCNNGIRWDPELGSHISDEEMCQFLMLASSCMVNGGSHNEEFALELLHKHSGDVRNAIKDLLNSNDPAAAAVNPAHSNKWAESEVDLFYEGLVKHHKNFYKISSDIKTKSTKECVEFYYLWKNVCQEEAQSFKNIFQVGESFTEVKSSVQDY